jgi:hypothetical protein
MAKNGAYLRIKNHGGHWEHGELNDSFVNKNLPPISKALVVLVFPVFPVVW